MLPKLSDALNMIESANQKIIDNRENPRIHNEAWCSQLETLLERFKQRLSQDTGLPTEYFTPVDPTAEKASSTEEAESSSNELHVENPELSPEAVRLYNEIETS